ncbi:hypothetical protein [Bradyrhizobium liaoningense]|uniref:hypothetical protein n=1 Tax=Bradyrhizobium liaoningense TaxID=43992 RepID=UPI0020127B03|nr:hypothetical protein [Bradyrhizobium liaoningense]
MAGSALALFLLGMSASVNGQGAPSRPQGGKTPEPELRGQWIRAGQTFACKVEAGKRITPPDPHILSFACQRMGALGVGISEASLKAVLGELHRKLPPANEDRALGLQALAFLFRSAREPRHLDPDQRSDRQGAIDSNARVPVTPATAPGGL